MKLVWEGKHFKAFHEEIRNVNGNIRTFEFVSRVDGTRTLAVNDKSQLLLTREYRYELEGFDWRLPGGKLDFQNEDVTAAAARELLEETGISAKNWKYFSSTTPDANIRFKRHFLIATDLAIGPQKLGEGEKISVHWVDFDKVKTMALEGLIQEEISALAVLRYIYQNDIEKGRLND